MQQLEQLLMQVADLVPDKVVIMAESQRTVFMNSAWPQYLGVNLPDALNYGWSRLIHPEEMDLFNRLHNKAEQGMETVEFECRILDRKGNYNWHLVKGKLIEKPAANASRWIYFYTEIQKLKEEEQRRTEFVTTVCHELKTPVSVIKGFAQLLISFLNDPSIKTFERDFLETFLHPINRQSDRITKLIDELNDISRLSEKKLVLFPELFRVDDLMLETINDLKYLCMTHEFTVAGDRNVHIHADKKRIQQVFINLINNAVKYSPNHNRVDISISAGIPENTVLISVKDYGIGISKEDQSKIFQRFYRAEGDNQQNFQGFGVGLFISNEIVRSHQGKLEVISQEGEGSEFKVYLPVNTHQNSSPPIL
jgi:two-component system phosphate regulon sensor histidine kinase PhoR